MIYYENILLCISLPLLVLLPFASKVARRFVLGFLIGMAMCLVGAYINSFFVYILNYSVMEGARFVSPLVEEGMKLLPIFLFSLLYQPEDRRLIAYAAVVGAGFATFENCCYITENGAELLRFVLFRGLAVGVMHVSSGLLLGGGLILVRRFRSVMLAGMVGVFSAAVIFHATYNLLVSVEGISTWIGFFMPLAITTILWVLWNRRKKPDVPDN